MEIEQPQSGFYNLSFGQMPEGKTYYHPWKRNAEGKAFDLRTSPALIKHANMVAKALGPTTGGAGTAGYALVPIYVSQIIHDESRKFTPLVELIPRVTNQGTTADYNVITAKGAAITANPDAALTEADSTYDRRSKAIKYIYSTGRVLGPMLAAMPSYTLQGFQARGAGNEAGNPFSDAVGGTAMQIEVLDKTRAIKEKEESLIVNGDSSTDATQFDGIVIQQSTTNRLNLASAALTYDNVETAVRYAYDDSGRPNLAVGSSAAIEDLRKIMVDTFRYTPRDMAAGGMLPFGVPSAFMIHTMVGPIVVIPSQYLSNTSGSKSIYFLDMNWVEMRVLQDLTYKALAPTNDSDKFVLKIYETLVLRAPNFNSFIANIL